MSSYIQFHLLFLLFVLGFFMWLLSVSESSGLSLWLTECCVFFLIDWIRFDLKKIDMLTLEFVNGKGNFISRDNTGHPSRKDVYLQY